VIERVRVRLMQRIAAESAQQTTAVPAGPDGWLPLLPGIERKLLHEQNGIVSCLLSFTAGTALPAHAHPVDEEYVVLSGTLRIGAIVLGPGSYLRVPAGARAAALIAQDAALVYIRGMLPGPGHPV